MTTVGQVRDAIKDAVHVTGIRSESYVLGAVNPPVAMVNRPAYDPRLVLGNERVAVEFTVTVYMQRDIEVAAQTLLEEYADPFGPKSIRQAIEDETNWPDQLVHYAQVINIGEVGITRIAEGIEYLSAVITVEVCW